MIARDKRSKAPFRVDLRHLNLGYIHLVFSRSLTTGQGVGDCGLRAVAAVALGGGCWTAKLYAIARNRIAVISSEATNAKIRIVFISDTLDLRSCECREMHVRSQLLAIRITRTVGKDQSIGMELRK